MYEFALTSSTDTRLKLPENKPCCDWRKETSASAPPTKNTTVFASLCIDRNRGMPQAVPQLLFQQLWVLEDEQKHASASASCCCFNLNSTLCDIKFCHCQRAAAQTHSSTQPTSEGSNCSCFWSVNCWQSKSFILMLTCDCFFEGS